DGVVRRLVPGLPCRRRVLVGRLLRVQNGCVVELGEGVHEQLPVRPDLGAVAEAGRQLAERIALERRDHRPEELAQRPLGLPRDADEDEALPDLAVDGHQAELALVDVEELVFLLDERQGAVEAVAPGVVLARELAAETLRLLFGRVVPHELVATVAADVVEGPHLVVHAPDDDDRRVHDGQLFGEVAALAGQLLDPADVQPRPLEDRFAFPLVELRGDRVGIGDRRRVEAEVLGPAALGGLRVSRTQGRGSFTRRSTASAASVIFGWWKISTAIDTMISEWMSCSRCSTSSGRSSSGYLSQNSMASSRRGEKAA